MGISRLVLTIRKPDFPLLTTEIQRLDRKEQVNVFVAHMPQEKDDSNLPLISSLSVQALYYTFQR